MLARQLEGVSVLVSPDRYLAGCLAEHQLDATIHVLDDGFQHLQLDRDIDILILGREDVARPVTLPGGRLREPLDTCIVADAIIAGDDDVEIDVRGMEIPLFRVTRTIGTPVWSGGGNHVAGALSAAPPGPVLAVAGIASPVRFFEDLRKAGHAVVETLAFSDHHPYSSSDVRRIFLRAAASGAGAVLTTEKDFVRLLPHRPFPIPTGWLPFTMEPDPILEFRRWLAESVGAARDMILTPESRFPHRESRTPESRTASSESRSANPESRTPESRTARSESRTANPESRTPESRTARSESRTANPESRTPESRTASSESRAANPESRTPSPDLG
jgi:hypothetical protein